MWVRTFFKIWAFFVSLLKFHSSHWSLPDFYEQWNISPCALFMRTKNLQRKNRVLWIDWIHYKLKKGKYYNDTRIYLYWKFRSSHWKKIENETICKIIFSFCQSLKNRYISYMLFSTLSIVFFLNANAWR